MDVSDIFNFFSARGGGRGKFGAFGRGGGQFFIEKGKGSRKGGGGGGPGRCLPEIWGGGANYFFRGRNARQGFFPRDTGKMAIFERKHLKMAIFPTRHRDKSHIVGGRRLGAH